MDRGQDVHVAGQGAELREGSAVHAVGLGVLPTNTKNQGSPIVRGAGRVKRLG